MQNSDMRLKNIAPVLKEYNREKIDRINKIRYNYTAKNRMDDKNRYGGEELRHVQ